MVFKTLEYYKKELSPLNLLFKYTWRSLIIVFTSISFILLGIITYYAIKINNIIMLLGVLSFLLFAIPLNIEYKKVLKNKYGIESKWLWNMIGFNELRRNLLDEYLKSNKCNIKGNDQLEKFISLVDKKAEEFKFPFFLNNGIVFAIIIPVWAKFIDWTYENTIPNFNEALRFLGLIVYLVFTIALYMHILKTTIFDEIINYDYNNLKKLSNDLKEIHLSRLLKNPTTT